MANNLQIATRQHTHLNDRTATLRSALELQHMVEPNNVNTILQLGRIYIMQEMDIMELVITLDNMEVFRPVLTLYVARISFNRSLTKISLGLRSNVEKTGKFYCGGVGGGGEEVFATGRMDNDTTLNTF